MKQLCGMACGDTRECVFFISTIPLYITHVQSSTCLYLWYKFGIFVHDDAITDCVYITTLPLRPHGKTNLIQKSVKAVTMLIKGNVSKPCWPRLFCVFARLKSKDVDA